MKMKKKNQWVALALAAVLSFSLAGCDDSANVASDQGDGSYKIAVAETTSNDETVNRRRYFTEYIGPKYDVEFVFSEAAADIDTLITFIENSADSGCDALIDYTSIDYETACRKCADYGILYIYNGPRDEAVFSGQYDNLIAAYGSNQAQTGELFTEYLRENASETGEEGFFVCSILACNGNEANTIITTAVLEALRDIYGLTYDKDISDYVTSSSPIYATNDKGINIYVYPGSNTEDTWLPGLSSELQTGKYKFLISAGQSYTNSSVVVDEVERAMNMDIKVMSVGAMSNALLSAYQTKDMFGNPSLDFVTVKAASQHAGIMFALTYNALTGAEQANHMENGDYSRITFNQFGLTSEEMVEKVASWDNADNGTWVVDYEIVDQMLAKNNPDLSGEAIQKVVDSITYESTLQRLEQK